MTPKYPIVSDINSAPNKWRKLCYAGRHCHKLTIVVAKEFNILKRVPIKGCDECVFVETTKVELIYGG